MNILEFAHNLLHYGDLESKLLGPEIVDDFSFTSLPDDKKTLPKRPARSGKLVMSEKQIKFPKAQAFHIEEKRALAMHFFANHELLAIEMMAAYILCVPHKTSAEEKAKRAVLSTIKDEQKHLRLYLDRMKDFSLSFGDLPMNDFFWCQMPLIKSSQEYFSVMALTLEAANLDFSNYFSSIFKVVGDDKSSKILNIVHEDEISHVALGVHFLENHKNDKTLWEYYRSCLPGNLTPARSKGHTVCKEARVRAGMPQDFLDLVCEYRDDYRVTNRRSWDQNA